MFWSFFNFFKQFLFFLAHLPCKSVISGRMTLKRGSWEQFLFILLGLFLNSESWPFLRWSDAGGETIIGEGLG